MNLAQWVASKLFLMRAPPPRPNAADKQSKPPPSSWHRVLGISEFAGNDEIRSAYRSLISRYHPDKVNSLGEESKALAEGKSKEITAAYREAMNSRGGFADTN